MSTRAQPDPERTEPAAAVDIVIVNWNAGALLRTCLAALAAADNASRLNVIVVDNASTDGSAQNLEAPSLSVTVIRNAENRGFAAACNQGAAAGRAPVILFLNPDVRVDRNAIARALDFLADPAQTATGVVGIRLLDREGHTARTCARRPTVAAMLLRTLFLDKIFPHLVPPHFMREWDHLDTRVVDQVMGAFLMIRRDLFARGGGFDERFFVYYEDLDLCLRTIDDGHAVDASGGGHGGARRRHHIRGKGSPPLLRDDQPRSIHAQVARQGSGLCADCDDRAAGNSAARCCGAGAVPARQLDAAGRRHVLAQPAAVDA